MSLGTHIDWTEATRNPVVGCRKVSEGCQNCYAERLAKRLAAMARADSKRGINPGKKAAYTKVMDTRGRWSGAVQEVPSALDEPRQWKKPRLVFVNSMGDLFHEGVSHAFVKKVFETMNRCPQHTFQILTKRPERASQLASTLNWSPNVFMEVSVENQKATSRIPILRRVPAAVRFLSLEPLLGPIPRLALTGIGWVIVGGESGPGARPMAPEWVRPIRDRCVQRNVPFFFKQWGGTNKKASGRLCALHHAEYGYAMTIMEQVGRATPRSNRCAARVPVEHTGCTEHAPEARAET